MKNRFIGLFVFTWIIMYGNVFAETRSEETAVFAMGCFWCGEADFKDSNHQALPGIISVRAGYAGGTQANPTYQNHEGYKEAVKIIYDPGNISYEKLLNIFWKNVDLLDAQGQFCDKGPSYTSVIFYSNEAQKNKALSSKEALKKQFYPQQVVTEILQNTSFYDAEEYHQNYKSKNPLRYKYYRWNCGRDNRLKELWEN